MGEIKEFVKNRIKTVNKFIKLPEYNNEILKSVIAILASDISQSFKKCQVFPDPNREFTLILTNKNKQFEITVRGKKDVDCIPLLTEGKIGEHSSTVEEVVNMLKESVN